jgi:23S rRNA (uracil1939-C5)-methyltransferase
MGYKIGDVIEVRVEKIVPRGLGLAFVDGLTVFVSLAAPGDLLRVQLTHIKKRIGFAEIVEIIESGPGRTEPPCVYFGHCGGCDFQQLTYSAQLEAKVAIISDCLTRIGNIDLSSEIEIVPSQLPFAYRSRARWHIDSAEKTFGYYARDTHNVIDVKSCPIVTPELDGILSELRSTLEWETVWGDRAEIEAATGDSESRSIFSRDLPATTEEISFSSTGHNYTFSAETFFQANRLLIPDLISAAIDDGAGADALDLYCGVGLFTLPLARRFQRVTGVEGHPAAAAFARKNVERARLENVAIINRRVDRFLAGSRKAPLDFVLIDPPRSGTEKGVIESLTNLKPSKIAYVSCEPSILARDLRIFLDAGYKIAKITALDLFPQTHHVETVVRLSL